ncbi:MAG TPA: glycosyltransferase [Desulfomonilia bacterium]
MINRTFPVIVAYKDIFGLQKCLKFINYQTNPINDVIIIDNSRCIDPVILSWKSVSEKPFKIHLYTSEDNLGSAGGFSLGMKKAFDEGAEWIWLHDEDDYPEKDCLEKLLKDGKGFIRAPVIKDPETGRVLNYFKRNKGMLGYMYPAPADADIVNAAGTAGLLIHRKVIEEIGIYDPSFFVGFEDWDYCLRAAKKGFKVHVVKTAIVYHPDHQSLRNRFIKEKILKYLPPIFGFIRKGNIRDEFAVKNIITLTQRHMSSYVMPFSLILSILSLPLFKIINRNANIFLTLKTYLKSLCAE